MADHLRVFFKVRCGKYLKVQNLEGQVEMQNLVSWFHFIIQFQSIHII